MKYLHEILWYVSWPLLIVVSYQAVKFVLKRFEKVEANRVKEEDYFDI